MSFAHGIEEKDELAKQFKEMFFSLTKSYARCGKVPSYYGKLEDLLCCLYKPCNQVTCEEIREGIALAESKFKMQLLHRLNVVYSSILPNKDEVRDAQRLALSFIHRFVQTGSNY
jgi:hypothetical protein